MPMRSPLRSDLQGARDTLRLEALSDGVIAIAITLLILEIRVPEGGESSPQEAWAALRELWPQYLGYLISFATIGIMWANHHLIFRFIARTNHYLILANLVLLFGIATIPFPTALMADTLGHPAERVGVTVYSGWFVVCALSFNVLWLYAVRTKDVLAPDADPEAIATVTRRFLLGPPAYLVAFLLAFVSPIASLLVLFGLTVTYVLPYNQ
jgi:uncharacterized membrane protein